VNYLGANLIWWHFRDGEIPSNGTCVSEIEAQYPMVLKVDVAYLPWEYDTNPDHTNAARLGLALTRRVPTVIFYESYSARNFNPQLFVDIESTFEQKMQLLQRFTNHYPINRDEVVAVRAKTWGFRARKRLAEAFTPDRYLIPMDRLI